VKLLVAADVAVAKLPPYVGVVEPIDGQCCFLDIAASTYDGLAMHLALLGVDFEVTEPAGAGGAGAAPRRTLPAGDGVT
jgi:hypothetical protein